MKHLLSVPNGSGPHPLLCFLHGYDEATPAPLESALTRHGPLRHGNPQWIKDEFIVLAPQLPLAGDVWHRYALDVSELVSDTLERQHGDRARVYLTGFSFGANGVFDLAHFEPRTWAALWAVDPTRVPRRVQQPVWLTVGEVTRHLTRAFVNALSLAPASGEPAADRLYEDRGEDHVGAARRAYADERIYSWLLRWRAA